MSLTTYTKKRDFKASPEPKGNSNKGPKMPVFIVHRHKARNLHYDFRIEADGVLKSWAVPKGPSMNPNDKRLAMMVEDHPYDYKDFEGIIPEGNYGAGIVEIWDNGTYSTLEQITDKLEIEKKIIEGIEKGSIKFHLYGENLKGEFALVKTHQKDYQDNAWLLIKHKDEFAVTEPYNSEDHTQNSSPINKWLTQHKDTPHGRSVKKTSAPDVIENETKELIKPMLAKEIPNPIDGKEWLFELKFDGYRAIAEIVNGNVRLYSRNGITFNRNYPLIIESLKKTKTNMIIDGEIVVLDEDGKPNFGSLQDYPKNKDYQLCFYVFDIISLKSQNLCNRPLLERKKILKDNCIFDDVVKYTDHILENGIKFFEAVKKLDLEGIMAKKTDSIYLPGKRTSSWLKIKKHSSKEAYIAGFTESAQGRSYFGSLVLAYPDNGKYTYAGHVGTGFNEATLKKIYELVLPLKTEHSPFDIKIPTKTRITWIEPKVMCKVKFFELTKAGIMRHPVFVDILKTPDREVKEVATTIQKASEMNVQHELKEKNFVFDKIEVKISHPDKIFFPQDNISKGMIADYYFKMADYILPFLKNRPQSLNRNPNGINDTGFYHKNAGEIAPSWVATKKIYSESSKKDIGYLICNDKASLMYLINLGCIELNPWHSTIADIDRPNYLVIDLDPSDNNTFSQVVEAANIVKTVLDRAKIECYCKTSGATGLHVFVPLGAKYNYEDVKNFAHLICVLTHEQVPSFTTLERNLYKRGKNKIYLDYLQNRRGQTIASVYSVRPRNGATVSVPLLWNEVNSDLNPLNFNIYNVHQRVEQVGDIFSNILGKGVDINKSLKYLNKKVH